MTPSDQDSLSFLYKKAFHIPTPDHVALNRHSNKATCKFSLLWCTEHTPRGLCLLGPYSTTQLLPQHWTSNLASSTTINLIEDLYYFTFYLWNFFLDSMKRGLRFGTQVNKRYVSIDCSKSLSYVLRSIDSKLYSCSSIMFLHFAIIWLLIFWFFKSYCCYKNWPGCCVSCWKWIWNANLYRNHHHINNKLKHFHLTLCHIKSLEISQAITAPYFLNHNQLIPVIIHLNLSIKNTWNLLCYLNYLVSWHTCHQQEATVKVSRADSLLLRQE